MNEYEQRRLASLAWAPNGASGPSDREDRSRVWRAVKTSGSNTTSRRRRVLGWSLLLGGVALIAWALS